MYLNPRVLDSGLTVLDTEGNQLHICSAEPSTYAGVSSVTLGNVALSAGSISAPQDRAGGGRQVTVAAITGGTVTATALTEARFYAIVDTVNSRLLAAGNLAAPLQSVIQPNTFNLAAFTIQMPGV